VGGNYLGFDWTVGRSIIGDMDEVRIQGTAGIGEGDLFKPETRERSVLVGKWCWPDQDIQAAEVWSRGKALVRLPGGRRKGLGRYQGDCRLFRSLEQPPDKPLCILAKTNIRPVPKPAVYYYSHARHYC
jgi:hypothetical protein